MRVGPADPRAEGAAAARSLLALPVTSCTSGELLGVYIVYNKQTMPTRFGGHANFSTDDATSLAHTLRLAALMIENVLLRGEKAALAPPTRGMSISSTATAGGTSRRPSMM